MNAALSAHPSHASMRSMLLRLPRDEEAARALGAAVLPPAARTVATPAAARVTTSSAGAASTSASPADDADEPCDGVEDTDDPRPRPGYKAPGAASDELEDTEEFDVRRGTLPTPLTQEPQPAQPPGGEPPPPGRPPMVRVHLARLAYKLYYTANPNLLHLNFLLNLGDKVALNLDLEFSRLEVHPLACGAPSRAASSRMRCPLACGVLSHAAPPSRAPSRAAPPRVCPHVRRPLVAQVRVLRSAGWGVAGGTLITADDPLDTVDGMEHTLSTGVLQLGALLKQTAEAPACSHRSTAQRGRGLGGGGGARGQGRGRGRGDGGGRPRRLDIAFYNASKGCFDEAWGGLMWRHHDLLEYRWLHVAPSPGDSSTLSISLEAVTVAEYAGARRAPRNPFAEKGASQEGHVPHIQKQPTSLPAQPDFEAVTGSGGVAATESGGTGGDS